MLQSCRCQPAAHPSRVRRHIRHGGAAPVRLTVASRPSASLTSVATGPDGLPTIDQAVVEAASDPAVQALATQIMEAEAELKNVFTPGKIPPKAAEVAKMRKNVSDMKHLLAAKLAGGDVAVDPDASDEEAERARQLFLEVEKTLQRQSHADEDSSFGFELSLLEEENERLRDVAEALLRRQAQLEVLAEQHGLIEFGKDGVMVWKKRPSVMAGASATDGPRSAPLAASQQLAMA